MNQGLMNRPAGVGQPLDFALPGGKSSRGFWTKRKKTATSLLLVMGLIAGVALAFKLFDQVVPNNVVRDASSFNFTIEARDLAAGETAFRPATGATTDDSVFRENLVTCPAVGDCFVNTFPGDSRTSEVRITNTNDPPRKDASFQVYVDPASIVVRDATLAVVPAGTPRSQFLSFWSLTVNKQTYWDTIPLFCPNNDCAENNPSNSLSYRQACSGALTSITKTAPCKLGIVRAAGEVAEDPTGGLLFSDPSDDRIYRFVMSEADNGTDQSAFKGWSIVFTLVFQARVPAEAEGDRYNAFPVP